MRYLEQLMSKASQVREATESSCSIDDVEKYVTGFNSWLRHAPVPTRPIWKTALFESSVLAEASLFLAVHGFYEEACAVLRGVLDSFLTRLYWDTLHKNDKLKKSQKNGRSTNEYWEWESGAEKKYPNRKTVWSTLLKEDGISRYDKQYGLKAEIHNQLSLLDKFVHGRPASRHYSGASRSSSVNIEFKKKHFEEWHERLRAVYRLVSVLSILQYPELLDSKHGLDFAALEPEVVARVRSILGSAPAHNFM